MPVVPIAEEHNDAAFALVLGDDVELATSIDIAGRKQHNNICRSENILTGGELLRG